MTGHYRISLDKKIAAKKVFLNNKETLITGYRETDLKAIVIVDGKEVVLTDEDNLIINGRENS